MIMDVDQLRTAMEQMERLIRALDDLKANVLPHHPELFATMAEAPLWIWTGCAMRPASTCTL